MKENIYNFAEPVKPKEKSLPESEGVDVPMKDKEKLRKEALVPIERDPESGIIFVLESELPYNEKGGSRVPEASSFSHFTLDKRTLLTIDKIATAVEMREPCLLEGETSTSKTSSIEYLAAVTNHERARINLNGQTDTSELIGKYVPNDGQLLIEFAEVLKKPELLTPQSLEIIQRANSEGHGLSMIESQKIAQNEGLKIPDWRWQDGIIPDAMKNGYWVILDEINLAEAQILERLNSVLEKNPSLVVSENGGMKIGENGQFPVHPNFRMFATMNPAEYTGRAPMSPAYKDRWTSYKFVETPNQEDYQQMMELLVYGQQPKVEIRGKQYQAEGTDSLFEMLGQVPNLRGFLVKLAKFHVAIEEMSRKRDIGKSKKEKYIFTRRGLLEMFDFMENKTIFDRESKTRTSILTDPKEIILRAIQYYYLDKIADPDDLKKITDQLDAIGISRDKWTHKFETEQTKEKEGIKPETKPETKERELSFEVGDRVRIVDSKGYSQHNGESGKIISMGGESFRVDLGRCTHDFPKDELEKLADAEKETGRESESKFKIGDEVVANKLADEKYSITKNGWRGRVTKLNPSDSDKDIYVDGPDLDGGAWVCSKRFDLVTGVEAEKDKEKESRPEFKVGDEVVGNELAGKKYSVTTKGWRGRIVESGSLDPGDDIVVQRIDGGETYSVESECFDLVKRAEGGAEAEERKFKMGDQVVTNEKISEFYPKAVKGWEGEVVELRPGSVDDLVVRGKDGSLFPVRSMCLDLITGASEKLEGHDAEKFLNDAFEWIGKNTTWSDRKRWFGIVYPDAKLVNMKSITSIPYIDTKDSVKTFGENETFNGIDELLDRLRGKKVVSIDSGGQWYLRIVD